MPSPLVSLRVICHIICDGASAVAPFPLRPQVMATSNCSRQCAQLLLDPASTEDPLPSFLQQAAMWLSNPTTDDAIALGFMSVLTASQHKQRLVCRFCCFCCVALETLPACESWHACASSHREACGEGTSYLGEQKPKCHGILCVKPESPRMSVHPVWPFKGMPVSSSALFQWLSVG